VIFSYDVSPEQTGFKHGTVKILVAYWGHFINSTDDYLKYLLYTNNPCYSFLPNTTNALVKLRSNIVVPGFNNTGPAIHNGGSTGNIWN